MSRNGELSLQRIIISYSTTNGCSNTRQFLSTHLPHFKSKYPSVVIDVRPRHWPEPGITGIYRDGSERYFNTYGLSTMGIGIRFHRLVNTCNDIDVPFQASHMHFQRRSIQGTWNPWLWMAERHHSRKRIPAWDRKLNEQEWEYYVDKYSTSAKLEAEAIESQVQDHTKIPKIMTEQVAEKWRDQVVPRLQTDIEHNIAAFKSNDASLKRGGSPGSIVNKVVDEGKYRLFAQPSLNEMGQDAVQALRGREMERLENWWRKRKEQLKPPA